MRASFGSWMLVACVGLAACGGGDDDGGEHSHGNTPPGGGAVAPAACTDQPTLAFCVGAEAPSWSLADQQSKSPTFEESYGLEALRGKVVLVAFLASWCPYCQAQTEYYETLRKELLAEGITDVVILSVNDIGAADSLQNLLVRGEFPMFQDTPEQVVWSKHRAAKDDVAIYDREGKLLKFYAVGSARDLQNPANYAEIKAALLAAR